MCSFCFRRGKTSNIVRSIFRSVHLSGVARGKRVVRVEEGPQRKILLLHRDIETVGDLLSVRSNEMDVVPGSRVIKALVMCEKDIFYGQGCEGPLASALT